MEPAYIYKAEVLRVIDGDTYEIRVDVGFDTDRRIDLRLKDVNTPEIRGEEKEEGFKVRNYVLDLFSRHHNQIVVKTHFRRSFTRWVGEAWLGDINLAEHLVEIGYAVEDKR